ncbi:unnamed protein product [Spirodela intermedia]|uniref:CASP-like protein n=1 Tax=Spirodela intermedia TaxID=51605 RepID=A0A7I8IC76_SPIIN|nr:unnamed protein product [Spirodela intermedia]CAA6654943.1 unnamed protein product [Spirodela intermedia]
MPSPSQLRNGGGEDQQGLPPLARGSPPLPNYQNQRHNHHQHFHSTVSVQRLRRVNALTLLLRLAAFCFCFASAVFMFADNARSPGSPSWLDYDPFRFVLAANAIVALYSFAEMGASIWEVLKGSTLLPEPLQLWFDFGHDQVFAYLLLSAEAAGTGEAVGLRKGKDSCSSGKAFCVQADISIALGFVGFVFLALSALFSGFRVGCYLLTGSRFPV